MALCADRVEKGKRSICKYSLTISDINIRALICKELNLSELVEQDVQNNISQVLITSNGQMDIVRCSELFLQQ